MSWQSDLHRYVKLDEEIGAMELREDDECTCGEFHTCGLHEEIGDRCIEQNRLMNLWGHLWVRKLYRISQGTEPATPVCFGKEATNA